MDPLWDSWGNTPKSASLTGSGRREFVQPNFLDHGRKQSSCSKDSDNSVGGGKAMPDDVKVVGPGFIAITVTDLARSAEFYEKQLGAVRDPYDFSPTSVAFLGWPAFALSVPRPGQRAASPDTTTIALWWRAADAQALYERVTSDGVRTLREPFDGPFGRTFVMADPDGYRITIYEKDQPLFWPPKG